MGLQHLGLAFLLLVASTSTVHATLASYCESIVPRVERCVNTAPRDLLFIVDGSSSMELRRFKEEMIDYTQALYCAFDPDAANTAGMIVFNKNIRVVIEQAVYTQNEWLEKTNAVREGEDNCCSCCTPTAEAFDLATEILTATTNEFKIAFVITDGVPSNNLAGSGGNPLWWYYAPVGNKASIGFNPAQYNAAIVGRRALLLKKVARLMIVGVPNYKGDQPDVDFFSGRNKYSASQTITVARDQKKWTFRYVVSQSGLSVNPIVTLPIEKNAFSSATWNVNSLVNSTVNSLCEITQSPTMTPTKKPTLTPTKTTSPTKRPTSLAPTRQPTKLPTKQPTFRPTSAKPTSKPTASPTRFSFEQIDITFVIDRSTSMLWQNSFCANVVATLPAVFPPGTGQSSSACWELFMRYILQQSDEVAAIANAGKANNRILGWAGDFGLTQGKGLRVQVIGFACENNQKTPKMFDFSDAFNNYEAITTRAKLIAMLNQIRVNVTPFGGTCPGLSIEQSVKYVERSPFALYPYQTVVLVTDGVFYDMPFPTKATLGLEAYKALRFSVGIAVAQAGNNYGLTPKEIATQKTQLTAFASEPSTFLNLGELGWKALLQDVSKSISSLISTKGPGLMLNPPIARYTWCGWRRIANCKQDNWRTNKCKWPNTSVKQWACKKK
ncbi:hypothetical protein BASA81_007575 [Batrachochytrium salamandrivorans]|nr:hypothetical protein BASA81_007575 [Batrachochytrium salamandrivorans]